MLIDLDDERLRLRLTFPSAERARLTLDYPREETYQRRVMQALSDLLRSNTPQPPSQTNSANGGAQEKDA